ncbi:PaaI family thioesterase [Desulfuribacillus alkaliarsenatis]|uniref:Thioesterase domain-containing protein n=1 Tax=Desulfuribacillus alkaliarsenatis TaxID=766136 RepID=A0A1E5FYS2_9FIRM|nr:hotdog fold thioesterase [Desulfuribacillus alkaliarsenatis]OEF95719.1 hypothetical protein BHF68_11475 [Desulfuribacillus alkaliarsenatis]
MADIEQMVAKGAYARHLGVQLLEHAPGYAKGKLELKPYLMNSLGIAHGGAIFSLADCIFAIASNSHEGSALGINVNIAYFKALREGTLYAEAKEVSLTSKLAHYLVHITNEKGEQIALFSGTVYRKV